MKNFVFISLIFAYSGCAYWFDETARTKQSNSSKYSNKFSRLEKEAVYDINNVKIYQNANDFKDKILTIRGSIFLDPFLAKDNKAVRILGSSEGYPIDIILMLDNPLQQQKRIDDNIVTLNNGKTVRIFGTLLGIEDFILTDGSSKKLPVIEGVAIFTDEDKRYETPVWVNILNR